MRVKKEVTEMEDAIIISENAPCYVNLTIPFILFYIFKSHSITMCDVLHPNAQQPKNMVDAHFGIVILHIDKFIREMDLGVITPDDVAEELVYENGMKGSTVDVLKVNQKPKRMRKWFATRDTTKSKVFDSIGKYANIKFYGMEKGCVHVFADEYSGGN